MTRKNWAAPLAWVKKNCKEGKDWNEKSHTRLQKDAEWEYAVKMTMIMRDMMDGSETLRQNGFYEEGLGNNAIAAGFQGQRQWTDFMPNGDFMEAMLCSSFDWNGIRRPYIVATENDCLNGTAMLFGQLLTNTAQIFSDVRTYWSPEAVRRVTGKELTGLAANGVIHLINSGATTLDATGEQEKDGKPAMKPFWEITDAEAQKCLDATQWCPASLGYFRGGGFSSHFRSKGGMPVTMSRINMVGEIGPVLQIAEGYTAELDGTCIRYWTERTDPTWPTTWFAPILTGKGRVYRRIQRDGKLGRQPRRGILRARGHGSDHACRHASDPGEHAQCSGRADIPSQCMEFVRHGGQGRRGLPCLPKFRPHVQIISFRLLRKPYYCVISPLPPQRRDNYACGRNVRNALY